MTLSSSYCMNKNNWTKAHKFTVTLHFYLRSITSIHNRVISWVEQAQNAAICGKSLTSFCLSQLESSGMDRVGTESVWLIRINIGKCSLKFTLVIIHPSIHTFIHQSIQLSIIFVLFFLWTSWSMAGLQFYLSALRPLMAAAFPCLLSTIPVLTAMRSQSAECSRCSGKQLTWQSALSPLMTRRLPWLMAEYLLLASMAPNSPCQASGPRMGCRAKREAEGGSRRGRWKPSPHCLALKRSCGNQFS